MTWLGGCGRRRRDMSALGGAVGPEQAERGAVGPEPAERGAVGPEQAERGVVGPEQAERGVVGPEQAQSATAQAAAMKGEAEIAGGYTTADLYPASRLERAAEAAARAGLDAL